MTDKKGNHDVTAIISVDIDTGEIDDLIWTEDHEAPPLVRSRVKKDGEKVKPQPS